MAESSYKDIMKSSGLIAYVQVFQMAFGLLRNKAIALLLGTSGFGIWGLYNTFMEMVTAFSCLGLDRSGVREIARNKDPESTAVCIWLLRRLILAMSVMLCVIIILFSRQISLFLFNQESFRYGIMVMSLVILCKSINSCNYSIMNGLRYLRFLASSQIRSTILGSTLAVIVVILGGERAITFALLSLAASMALFSTYYVHKLNVITRKPSMAEARPIIKSLYSLGIGFCVSSIISTVMTLLSRSYLSSHFDFGAVGIYQASWTISNLYIGIILSAMGVDFMPRLTKVADSREETNKLINQQLEMGLLLSCIGVVGILLFSDYILYLLYSKDFMIGSEIIRWQVLGVALRIFAFPFSFTIAAKGNSVLYAITQLVFWTLDYLLLMFFGNMLGFDGLGVNYVVAYCVFVAMVFGACLYFYQFKLERPVIKLLLINAFFIAFAWITSYFCVGVLKVVIGIIELTIITYFINHYLINNMKINVIDIIKKKLKRKS